jgi:DNA polymerase sigma
LDFSKVCLDELRNLLKWIFNNAGYGDIELTLYGSQANGLMLKGSSDIDVTITLPES